MRMRSRESWQRFVFLADPSKTWQLVCQQDARILSHRRLGRPAPVLREFREHRARIEREVGSVRRPPAPFPRPL